MAKTVKVLPRPTVEQMNEYSQLKGQLYHADLSSKETAEIAEQFRRLATSYNWTNCAFIDPDTGKFGITNAAGEVLVPTKFDGFTFLGDNDFFRTKHMAAKKDGMFGIVAADGSGDVLVDFRFDYLLWNPFAGMYAACWGGKDEYGFVSYQGKVIIPNILTEYGEPCYGHMILETQDKMGILDLRTSHFVLPEYDLIEVELDEKVLFIKDGVKGYVVERTGQFIPEDEYDEENMSDEDIVYNTFD